jgi:hypothetical protein
MILHYYLYYGNLATIIMAAKKSPSKSSGKKPVDKWAQDVDVKEGTLHKALGIPKDKDIGKTLMNKIAKTPVGGKITTPSGKSKTVTSKMKHKVQYVKNVNKKY